MKILVLHNRYRSGAPSGENRVVDQEREALLEQGHIVERFERHSDDITQWSWTKRATVPVRVIWSQGTRRALGEVIASFRPDVVHIHNTFPLMSPSVLYACRELRVPTVITIHNSRLLCASGDFFRNGTTCHDCLDRRLPFPALTHRCYRGSLAATAPIVIGMVANREAWRTMGSAYIFISEAQRANFSKMALPARRTFVKGNLVPERASPSKSVESGNIIAYVGRLDSAKGVPVLMEAWDRYRARSREGLMQLVIAGSGPLEAEVVAWAAATPSVAAVGLISPPECAALIARARAVILPSLCEETFGLVAIEAMAAGVAPVASARGAFPELIRDRTDGVLFEPGNAESLAIILQDIESHPERYRAYGQAASRASGQRFDPKRNLDQLIGIYNFAIDNPIFGESQLATAARPMSETI